MICRDCGRNHSNQFKEYPKGSRVIVTGDFWGSVDITRYNPLEEPADKALRQAQEGPPRILIPAGSAGRIVDHCNDGRVLVQFEAEEGKSICTHSFHAPETYFMVAIGRQADI